MLIFIRGRNSQLLLLIELVSHGKFARLKALLDEKIFLLSTHCDIGLFRHASSCEKETPAQADSRMSKCVFVCVCVCVCVCVSDCPSVIISLHGWGYFCVR